MYLVTKNGCPVTGEVYENYLFCELWIKEFKNDDENADDFDIEAVIV